MKRDVGGTVPYRNFCIQQKKTGCHFWLEILSFITFTKSRIHLGEFSAREILGSEADRFQLQLHEILAQSSNAGFSSGSLSLAARSSVNFSMGIF